MEDAKASGARVVAGGNRFSPNGKNGYFYEPTILADVQEGVRIVDEEQFGPVMPLIKYSDVDDALVPTRHGTAQPTFGRFLAGRYCSAACAISAVCSSMSMWLVVHTHPGCR